MFGSTHSRACCPTLLTVQASDALAKVRKVLGEQKNSGTQAANDTERAQTRYSFEESRLARDSVNGSLKGIISIVMGLALTNTVVALVTGGHYDAIHRLAQLPVVSVLYSIVLVATIVRFYHGNLRHFEHVHGYVAVEDRYARSESSLDASLGVDFIVILVESMLFAVGSFYARRAPDFLLLILVLLVIDISWFVVNLRETGARDAVEHQRRWLFNNFLAFVAIGFCYFAAEVTHLKLYVDVGAAAVAVNTLIDFAISWDFYFPRLGRASGVAPTAS
jgi:hypothetical protein